ncbi:hypothetical protein GCM10025857_07140 [Alicyclobacillus contaminans]|uniref:hypothetical protein n=1 Tax=Alicyclobacillus contaminans TaxID=392016 RepID=UPI000479D1B8|nr:hypothetical protein [Alicyclobacillus contaminans]GMA49357.1 hypothetical protein GCM10025857_07140 [Alicyclobacillus contaminans]
MQSIHELRHMIDAYILREPPEPDCVANCAGCGNEMFEGDEATEFDGEFFCSEECIGRYLLRLGHATAVVLGGDD